MHKAYMWGGSVRCDDFRSGLYGFGLAQLSAENAKMTRRILGEAVEGDVTLWGAVVSIGGGRAWRMTPSFAVGPLAWLDYSAAYRPDLTEDADKGAALHVQSGVYQQLWSNFGVKADWSLTGGAPQAQISAALAWSHAFLDDCGKATAAFASWRSETFESRARTASRDAAEFSVRASVQLPQNLSAWASLGVEAGDGVCAVGGAAALQWRF